MKRVFVLFFCLMLVVAGCSPASQAQSPAASGAQAPAATSAATPAVIPAATAAAGQAAATSGQLTKVTLAMGYIPSVQFAPFYVAQERGYFKAAGLDVTFQYGSESDLIKLVGTNQLPFMIGSGEEVILGRSQGLPVRYAMRWYRKFPVVLMAEASRGITQPKDLEGKSVGVPVFSGANYVGWKALVYATGIDESKVKLQAIGYTLASAVSQGRVDAAMDYLVNGPVQLRLAGEQITEIPVSNYIDLPSNGIITNDQMIREQPQVVQALVSATLHGLSDTLADPNAAFAICLKAVPEAGGAQEKTNRAIFDASLGIWQADPSSLGKSDPAAWAAAATFMRKMGLIQQDVNPSDLYTNDFIK